MSDFSIKSSSNTKKDGKQSFLHEAQQEGKAQGKMDLSHLDEAMDNICNIINEDAVAMYKNTPESDWPTIRVACYSPRAESIVAGKIIHSRRGKPTVICDKTGSKHLVRARESVLVRHFHLDEETKARKKREKDPKKENKSPRNASTKDVNAADNGSEKNR
jgi:hypothetical protein